LAEGIGVEECKDFIGIGNLKVFGNIHAVVLFAVSFEGIDITPYRVPVRIDLADR
jgi:hypothetical protein